MGAIKEIYLNRELPLLQRLGIIALIPKSDKDQRFITKWRPLSLLETLYKLISATLPNRIKPVINKTNGKHQMTYIPIDFQFLIATLEMFGFGEYFVNWIKIILGCNEGTNFWAVTVVNGNISSSFEVKRGC